MDQKGDWVNNCKEGEQLTGTCHCLHEICWSGQICLPNFYNVLWEVEKIPGLAFKRHEFSFSPHCHGKPWIVLWTEKITIFVGQSRYNDNENKMFKIHKVIKPYKWPQKLVFSNLHSVTKLCILIFLSLFLLIF